MHFQSNLLNEHQRRALSTRLAMLDRWLYDVEQVLSDDCPRGEMFEVINDLTDGQRERVLRLLNEARDQIRVSRECFGLEPKREYLHQWLAGHFSIFWTILEDSRAAKLKGFGGVSPDLAAQLDPQIDRLVHLVNSIKSAAINMGPQ